MSDEMMSFNDALQQLGVDKKTLHKLITAGTIKAYSEGGTFQFKSEDISAYLESQGEGDVPTVVLDDDIDLDDIDAMDLDDIELDDIDAAPATTASDDDYDGLDIGGLDVDPDEDRGSDDEIDLDDISLDDIDDLDAAPAVSGSDTVSAEGGFDLDDDLSLDGLDEEIGSTTLDEISLDDATGSGGLTDATSTVALDGDTGMTEELDLGSETLDLSDDNLFPDDTSVTGEVTADFDLDDAVTGEIEMTDPIDVTADLDMDLPGEPVGAAAPSVGRIQVKKEMDWIWMALAAIGLGVVINAGLPTFALNRDYIPEYLKSVVKDPELAPKSGGLNEVKKAGGSFGKISSEIK